MTQELQGLEKYGMVGKGSHVILGKMFRKSGAIRKGEADSSAE